MRVFVSFTLPVILVVTAARIDRSALDEQAPVRFHEAIHVRARAPRTCTVLVTAYNSVDSQTDPTPFITASLTRTRHGILAARWLPMGTRVRIHHENYADEVFIVEDRMHHRNWCKADIWMERTEDADAWGKQFVLLEVMDVPEGFACPVQPPSVDYGCPEPESEWARRAATPVCPIWDESCQPQDRVNVAMQ